MVGLETLLYKIPRAPAPEIKVGPNNYVESSIAPYIVDAKLLKKFVIPLFKLYDGIMDPKEHMAVYKQQILASNILQEIRKTCMCRTFQHKSSWTNLPMVGQLPN